MSSDDDAPLTPAEQIVADASAGKLTTEQATLQLLAEIANGLWYAVADLDELLDMARETSSPVARMH